MIDLRIMYGYIETVLFVLLLCEKSFLSLVFYFSQLGINDEPAM